MQLYTRYQPCARLYEYKMITTWVYATDRYFARAVSASPQGVGCRDVSRSDDDCNVAAGGTGESARYRSGLRHATPPRDGRLLLDPKNNWCLGICRILWRTQNGDGGEGGWGTGGELIIIITNKSMHFYPQNIESNTCVDAPI